MTEADCNAVRDQSIDIMIDLARLSQSHRIVAAGNDSFRIRRELHRRGYVHAVTATSCGMPRGQHVAALIAGDGTYHALETSLIRVSPFLNAMATIVISIESQEKGVSLKVRAKLEQLGFRIEAGVRCQHGLMLSAYRHSFGSIAKAA